MDLKGRLRPGMRIFGADDRDYGAIDRWDDDHVYVGQRRIPLGAFERLDNDRLYVGETGRQHFETDARGATEGEIRVPVMEERLEVGKQAVELGEVEIRKEVVAEQVNVPVDVMREDVRVQQVDMADRPVAAGDMADAFQEATIRVPVRGEEVVVEKQPVMTGEVVIDRERTTERQTVVDTIRKERVDVDESYRRDRAALEEHFNARRSAPGVGTGARTFAEAEPNYRMGYETAYDERYAGRDWDTVEPELRANWRTAGARGGQTWEDLRDEIREGWNRGRAR